MNDEEEERLESRGGPGGDPSWGPGTRHTSIAAGDEDRGMADSAAVNGKWDGTGCAGMARCPLKIHQIQIYSKQKLSKSDLISYYTNT